jgi:hypothetical protein
MKSGRAQVQQTPRGRDGPVRVRAPRGMAGVPGPAAAWTVVLRDRRWYPWAALVGHRRSSRAAPPDAPSRVRRRFAPQQLRHASARAGGEPGSRSRRPAAKSSSSLVTAARATERPSRLATSVWLLASDSGHAGPRAGPRRDRCFAQGAVPAAGATSTASAPLSCASRSRSIVALSAARPPLPSTAASPRRGSRSALVRQRPRRASLDPAKHQELGVDPS